MTLQSLIELAAASDAGGVAGRVGYDYQAHVAAGFVLKMISDPELAQVECETADDVTLRWQRNVRSEIEYVQVKTTDDNSKWGIAELTQRTQSKVGSSLMEKSLACDAFSNGYAMFRFVSSRDVRGDLRNFKIPREKRLPADPRIGKLIKSFGGKYRNFKSPQRNSTAYWAENMFWEVEANEAALEQKNIHRLLREAENKGEHPSISSAEAAYDNLLKVVFLASKASRVTDPEEKAISRESALAWWKVWLSKFSDANLRSLKVYKANQSEFFSLISDVSEIDIKRSLQAFDAEFDGGTWRKDDLARYLCDWLPEISLQAKVLASFSHLEARQLVKRALEAFKASEAIEIERLLAELLLHAVLRQYRKSEPFACKLFTSSAGLIHKNSAHIVHTNSLDEIWLGQARLVAADSHEDTISEVLGQISQTFDRDIVKREREVIVQLRDPNHMKSINIERALERNSKLDEFLKVLRVPILIAYDSDVVGCGESSDYVENLICEVDARYTKMKSALPENMQDVEVCIFLIPVECVVALAASFKGHLDGH